MAHSRFFQSIAVAALAVAVSAPGAHAMKAKYYKECYAPIEAAEDMVDRPKGNGGAKALGGLGKAAGVLGSFGGLGGLGSAAGTAVRIQQYSGYIQSASGLAASMQEQHPNADDRWGAYGDQMGEEVEKLSQVRDAVVEAQGCYDAAHDTLGAQVASGELKSKKAKKYLKEIKKGSTETGDLLKAALDQMQNNGNAYNEALGGDTAGLNLGQQASFCVNPAPGMANWCSKYGSAPTSLTTDAFNRSFYAGNYGAARAAVGLHHMNALAGLGALRGAGVQSSAVPARGSNVEKLGMKSEAYIALYEQMLPLVETQKALETKAQTKPWS